jgi:hypothetical protein
MNVDGEPQFGRYADCVWTINWSNIRRNLNSAWMCDILLLLNCYVPPWTWERVYKGGENVMEAISRVSNPKYSFTKVLTYAFRAMHDLFLVGQLPVFTTGILFNSLLEWCQSWKGSDALSRWDVPVHQMLKQDPDCPRAIQLQPLCNHNDYDWNNQFCSLSQMGSNLGYPRVPGWLFSKAPKFRLEVALNDYELLVNDLVHGADPWGYWLRHFPALKSCIKADKTQLLRFYSSLADGKVFTVMTIPAALAIYLPPEFIPAIARMDFKVPEPTTLQSSFHERGPLESGYDAERWLQRDGSLTGREYGSGNSEILGAQLQESRQRLEEVQRHYSSVLDSLNGILETANTHVSALRDRHGLDAGSLSTELLPLFAQVGAEVDKIDEKVDLTDMRQVDLACTIHNIFQDVKNRFFPPAIDRSWCVNIFEDCDKPTIEHVEDRDPAGSDDGWETDSDFSQERHPEPSAGLDGSRGRHGASCSCRGDTGGRELVSDGRPAESDSEMFW